MSGEEEEDIETYVLFLRLFRTRDEVAEWYASMLRLEGSGWSEWPLVSQAILRRWSPSGLRYIKTKAWKIASEQ